MILGRIIAPPSVLGVLRGRERRPTLLLAYPEANSDFAEIRIGKTENRPLPSQHYEILPTFPARYFARPARVVQPRICG